MFTTFVFDFDNTIAITEYAHRRSFEEFFKKEGVQISQEYWYKYYAGKGSSHIILDILDRFNIETTFSIEDLVDQRRDIYIKSLEFVKLELVEGFSDFVKRISDRGMKKIIASSSGRKDLVQSMKNVGIANFEYVCADDVDNLKPNPEIFLKAASASNSKIEQCIVIEDSFAGIEAAKNAGMFCIALTTSKSKEELMTYSPDIIVNDYNEINMDRILNLQVTDS